MPFNSVSGGAARLSRWAPNWWSEDKAMAAADVGEKRSLEERSSMAFRTVVGDIALARKLLRP